MACFRCEFVSFEFLSRTAILDAVTGAASEMNEDIKRQPEKETARLEAFSDGVFAIAITLLILELKVPALESSQISPAVLGKALLQQWPSYVALVTSFFTILLMWVHHHAILRNVCRTDAWLHFANGCLLLGVTFVPYPTSVLATYLPTHAAKMAAAFYSGTFVFMAFCFYLFIRAAFRKPLLSPSASDVFIAKTCHDYMFGPPLYFLATISALLDVRVSLLICTALWIFWATTITKNTRA
jgi:TMEM175 potassium channel family protein